MELSQHDLEFARFVLDRLLRHPDLLAWFDRGNTEKARAKQDSLHDFVMHLANVADCLGDQLIKVEGTADLGLPPPMDRPRGIEALLFRLTRRLDVKFQGQPWRVLLLAAEGELHRIGAVVNEAKRGRGKRPKRKAGPAENHRGKEECPSEHGIGMVV
jgi:hypothetical protein